MYSQLAHADGLLNGEKLAEGIEVLSNQRQGRLLTWSSDGKTPSRHHDNQGTRSDARRAARPAPGLL